MAKITSSLDETTNLVHAVELTTNAVSDASMVKPLLASVSQLISKVGADGAYDKVKVYDVLAGRQIEPLIPPRVNAVIWTDETGVPLLHPRNEALKTINVVGLAAWKQQSGYHRRSKAETGMFRWKTIFGDQLATRLLAHQQLEAQIKATCLNRLTQLGMPKTVRCYST